MVHGTLNNEVKMDGWVKIHRSLLDSRYGKNCEMLGFWSYLLLIVNHKKSHFTPSGIKLNAGQVITGRKRISSETGLNESKVERFLKKLEIEQQIEQQKTTKYRIISIVNWGKYQVDEQGLEQQVNNKRTTNEQQANTKQECKNEKNEKKKDVNVHADKIKKIIDYLNHKTGKRFRDTSITVIKHVTLRLNESYLLEDFFRVIDVKVSHFNAGSFDQKYLRPETLFGNKFDGYLNEDNEKSSEQEVQESTKLLVDLMDRAMEGISGG